MKEHLLIMITVSVGDPPVGNMDARLEISSHYITFPALRRMTALSGYLYTPPLPSGKG